MRLRAFLTVAITSSVIACSSDGGGPGSTDNSSIDGACRDYSTRVRAYFDRCSTGLSMSPARFESYIERLRLACNASLQVNGLSYTPAQFSACATAAFTGQCGVETDDIAACDFPPGTLANGTACVSNAQCQTNYCAKPRSETLTASTCGTCQPRVAVGGDCASSAGCVEGAVCDAMNKCVARTLSDAGGPCGTSSAACKTDLYCDSMVCKPRGDSGATCTSSLQCKTGLRCDMGKCAAQVVSKEGEACGTTTLTCGEGLSCDAATMKCAKVTYLAPGATCGAPLTRCERGSCDTTTKKCPAVIADGGACLADRSTGVCDDLASCIDGKCVFAGQVVCK